MLKKLLLFVSVVVLFSEFGLFYLNHESLLAWGKDYLLIAPLLFFKSFFKKLLLLNFFGVAKLLLTIFWHTTKLLFIKFMKTIGIRYGTYFAQQKWQKLSQRFRIFIKKITRRTRAFQKMIASLSRLEFTIVLIAFLPVFLLLFLFGIGFRMTRDVMVKKGSEIGVTNVAVKTAKKSRGLVARLKQADMWLLQRIAAVKKNDKK